jgi:hypothetical protein
LQGKQKRRLELKRRFVREGKSLGLLQRVH